MLGRLTPDGTAAQAEQQATVAIARQRLALGDATDPPRLQAGSLVPGRGADRPREVQVSLWLTGVSSFVLLIACANIADLVLVRNLGRRRDYLVRIAVGASPSRIVRHLLGEVAALVALGTGAAVLIGWVVRRMITAFVSDQVPFSDRLFDPRAVAIIGLSALVALAVVATASLVHARLSGLTGTLGAVRPDSGRVGRRTRRGFLIVQAGLTVALLFVAQLFATSLQRVRSLDLGVQPDQTIQVRIQFERGGREDAEIHAIHERALDAMRADPAVALAAVAEGSPYQSGSGSSPWTADRSRDELWGDREVAYRSAVGDRFFATVGATSLRGRDFDERDRAGSELVAIINAPLARHLWPDRDAVGQCMLLGSAGTCVRVVGVLGGVWKFSILERDKMVLYTPLAQSPDALPGSLYIRPHGDARTLLPIVRSRMQAENPELPAVRISLVRDIVEPEMRPWRFGARIFSAFSIVALVIAAVGLHGVVSLGVALRTKEIGVRMALGARRSHIAMVVAREGMVDVAVGLLGGALLVFAASRWLSGVLFQTSPTDWVMGVQTVLVLAAVSLIAVMAPIVRALRTDVAAVLQSSAGAA